MSTMPHDPLAVASRWATAGMGDDEGAGTAVRSGHGIRHPHDRRQPCLPLIHPAHSPVHHQPDKPALCRGPGLLPTAHRRAGGRTPPETRPRRHGRVAAGPGSIAPCPTPGPVPARTGRGRCQAAPRAPARAAPAGPGRSPLRPRSPPASLPSRPVFRPEAWQSLRHLLAGWSAGSWTCTPPALATTWHRGEHPRHAPPPPGNAGVATRATLTSRGCGATRSGGDHKSDRRRTAWEGADR